MAEKTVLQRAREYAETHIPERRILSDVEKLRLQQIFDRVCIDFIIKHYNPDEDTVYPREELMEQCFCIAEHIFDSLPELIESIEKGN